MIDVGLLVLSSRSLPKYQSLLKLAAESVRSKLYVRIENGDLEALMPQLYLQSSLACPNLDVRIMMADKLPFHNGIIGDEQPGKMIVPAKKYSEVVMGGTFDRIHNGHKTLLSRAILQASSKLYCGVTDIAMIHKKTLWELIAPVESRISDVEEFVYDVSDGLKCITFPLDDPFGQSITVPSLEAIVVSKETIRGGHAVNEKRKAAGLCQLDVDVIELLDANDKVLNEVKISSSTRRREALGCLLREPTRASNNGNPYIIGLTGGIASGKSNIAKYLQQQPDFEVIDCDKLAHDAYKPGSELCKRIGELFEGVVDSTGAVDRKRLGAIVFNDSEQRLKLNGVVWPTLMNQVQGMIQSSRKKFIVVEAAALIEAGWHTKMNELWTVFVPRDEAVRRVVERDGSTQEQAEARLAAQIDNKARVDASHVVFCSLWAYEETRKQVMKAVEGLRMRVSA